MNASQRSTLAANLRLSWPCNFWSSSPTPQPSRPPNSAGAAAVGDHRGALFARPGVRWGGEAVGPSGQRPGSAWRGAVGVEGRWFGGFRGSGCDIGFSMKQERWRSEIQNDGLMALPEGVLAPQGSLLSLQHSQTYTQVNSLLASTRKYTKKAEFIEIPTTAALSPATTFESSPSGLET